MVTPLTANGPVSSASFSVGRIAVAALTLGLAAGVAHAAPPKIRTDAGNSRAALRDAQAPDGLHQDAQLQSRPALCRHRRRLQAPRRNLARAVGLRLLPDGGRDQLPHLPQAATAAGATSIRSRTTLPASAPPGAACRATAIPTSTPASWRRSSTSSSIPASASTSRSAHAPRLKQDDILVDHGEQEGTHHLRRSGASLGRRQALRRLDRMGGEQFPPAVLQRCRSAPRTPSRHPPVR